MAASVAAPYVAAFLASMSFGLKADALYGSRLLGSFSTHLKQVAAQPSPLAAKSYLEAQAFGGGDPAILRAAVGRESVAPEKASALLVAHALARPRELGEVLGGLEERKKGLGAGVSAALRDAEGSGDPRILRALRSLGRSQPQGLEYDERGRFAGFWDGALVSATPAHEEPPVAAPSGYTGLARDGRPRSTGLVKATVGRTSALERRPTPAAP